MIYFSIFAISLYLLTKLIGHVASGVVAVSKSKRLGKNHILLSKGWVTLYKEIQELEDNLDYLSINRLVKECSNFEETVQVWTEYHYSLEFLTSLEIMQNNFHQDGYKSVDIVIQEGDTLKTISFDDYVNMVSDNRDTLYDEAIFMEDFCKQLQYEESLNEN